MATSACANPMATAQAGRAGDAGAAYRGDRAHLALRRPPAHHVLGRPLAAAGRRAAPSLPQFVALLTSVPALATTFSLTLARGERQEVAAHRARADHRAQRRGTGRRAARVGADARAAVQDRARPARP